MGVLSYTRQLATLCALSATGLCLTGGEVAAQQFTTAEEVRPMLDITRDDWITVREFDGKDQLLFTQILAWRCGLDGVSYAVNGGDRAKLEMEPCYEGETQPNAIRDDAFLPYVFLDLGAVQSVEVWLTYDDGDNDSESFTRDAVLSR